MGKMSTTKGKVGEREFVNLAKSEGLSADRTAALQAGGVEGASDSVIREWPELHVEVKRDERMSVDRMVAQAEAEASPGAVPVVAWRRNGSGVKGWRMAVPAAWLLALLAELHTYRTGGQS